MNSIGRSTLFSEKENNRYWWHRVTNCNYIPLIYSSLSNEEWMVMEEWFIDSDIKYQNTGEAGISPISLLIGLITGNGISRIVQCGHYIGYSTLILGFYLRKMRKTNSLYSIDIDQSVTEYSQHWINKASLDSYVKLVVDDSSSLQQPLLAKNYLSGSPQIVFIDSSHQYSHTIKELDLWFPHLCPGGFVVLHDTSLFAKNFDNSSGGGVGKAVYEWSNNKNASLININGFVNGGKPGDYPYLDGCGLTLIQKLPV